MKIEVHLHRLTTAETSEEETKAINERAAEVSEAAAALLDHLTVSAVRSFSDTAAYPLNSD